MNANEHIRNRNAYPTEKLLLYRGKFVAWAGDGKEILASADDIPELIDAFDAKYPIGTEFVISFVPAEWDGTHDRPKSPEPTWLAPGAPS
ncbi:DUF5678 domain-containing protein [Gemmata sp.]|uniref:DUF5678 domain-containing protein n=1 Tax=Gemmata sp. TaxID=1914242 RepID=UPI003F715CB2